MDEKCCGNCSLYDMLGEYCYTLQEEHYPDDQPCHLWENYEDHLGELREYYNEHPDERMEAIATMRAENEKAYRDFRVI